MSVPTDSMVVLHVDDDVEFTTVAAELLEDESDRLTVETVSDAETGLAQLDGGDFDCVVSDYEMPGRDGIAFLETVREDYPDLPFILFTGKGSEEIASEAISAGVTDYLQKGGGVDQYAILANRIENAVERRRARVRQRQAERRFRAIFDDPDKLISVVTPDGRIRQINDTTMTYVDADREDVIDEPFWETPWWSEVERSEARELTQRVADGEYVEFEIERSPPGRDRYVLSGTVRPVTDESGSVVAFVASARDVTEEVERKRELRRYERMVNTMQEAACIYDADGRFALVNEYLADFYGTTRERLEGRESNLLPKVRAQYTDDPFAELLAGEREEVHGEVDGEFPGHGHEALEYRLTPFRIDGEIEGVVGVTHEITELKERERTLQRQNERLDQFASFVAHDLRNPLNVATGRLTLAAEECDSDHLANVSDALDRMEALIEDLLTFAREGQPVEAVEPVALRPVFEERWRVLPTEEANLRVETDVTIRAAPDRLAQLLENLIDNAVTHGGSTVTITVGDVDEGSGFFVADDGPGIAPEDRETVFEAGYSTTDEGTGFGLSIVAEIADAHGWDVTVTDSESGGARFEFTDVNVT
ncbi:hybrid sensor histidine kinase/response regulator [Halorhabdus amylolytica]|uniref:hybrid sensor histidine kinase/response regulator n=1 Tax=Halorhabdus amylolytica TaxID=2559573 RepID=UPI0010AB4561|nr:PAS domain-containing protein [Halorhabdus amylolytica]